ncbi:DUF6266 family protein [Pedobacter gandavensis]|uniref:Phage MuF C-terminal domain-containing protein n=1 Tax=Pedobacter gandavensis TaxID=2679963 RepID=A0ABR6F241_9SPHI|nr:DUF6266 family protein [Pedobacter gandavensis]MBB2151607.1 hypothetical protein [Pedobacter gandavensis]
MAIALNGPQGHFSGKIGNLVFYMLNGIPVVRRIGRVGKPSRAQLANHSSMSVTNKLLASMKGFIKLGYGLQAKGTPQNAHNLATSYHKKHALTGEYPNIKVDYSKVILSKGLVPVADDLKIVKTSTGLEISWNPTYEAKETRYDDIVMVMLCYPESDKGTEYLNIARREEGKCFIGLSEHHLQQQIEPYISFRSADGEKVSDSTYLGNINGEQERPEERNNREKYNQVSKRFDQVANIYHSQLKENDVDQLNSKAFRHLRKEYQVLKEKLERTPGKPG